MSGLPERPSVPPEVRSAIHAAVEQLLAAIPGGPADVSPWRFSGRWFSAHPIRGRSRPG